MRIVSAFIIFLFIHVESFSQQGNATVIIDGLLEKFRKVNTYEADVIVKPDISFLKILPQNGKIYFKQPDLFRIKTTGISILPKQQFDNIFTLLTERSSYLPVFTGRENLQGSNVAVINIIPLADTSELILARLWVDDAKLLIQKAQLTTRTNGTIEVLYRHGKYAEYGLPDNITFIVDVKKFKVPKAVSADINSSSKNREDNTAQPKKGTISVAVSNYILNKPLPAGVFKSGK